MALVVPPMAGPSVTPTARSTRVHAVPTMAGVGTRLRTVGLAASLAARRPLPQQIPLHLDLTAVAALPSVAPLVMPMVRMEAAAQRMDIAARRPITVRLGARADAMADPAVEQTQRRQEQQYPLRPKSPSWAYPPLAPTTDQSLRMEPVAPQMAALPVVIGHKAAAALLMVYVLVARMCPHMLTST